MHVCSMLHGHWSRNLCRWDARVSYSDPSRLSKCTRSHAERPLAHRRLVLLWVVRGDDTEMICDLNRRFHDRPIDCSQWRGKVPTISKVGALGVAYYIFGILNTLVVLLSVPVHLVLGRDVERRSPAMCTPLLRCLIAVCGITLPSVAWMGVTISPVHDAIAIVFGVAILSHTLIVWSLQHPGALERLVRSFCSTSVRGAPAECRLIVRSVRAARPIEQCKAAIVGAYAALGVALLLVAVADRQQPSPSTFTAQVGPVGEWLAALLTALSQVVHAVEVSRMSRRPNPSGYRPHTDDL